MSESFEPPTQQEQSLQALAEALLHVVPKISRHMRSDVPLVDSRAREREELPGLLELTELRATPGQLTLLQILIEREICTMQELAFQLGVAPSTATAMVKRLFAQGYVERRRDNVDWRSVLVSATERGRQAVDVYNHASSHFLQERLERLSAEERTYLYKAIPALRQLSEDITKKAQQETL